MYRVGLLMTALYPLWVDVCMIYLVYGIRYRSVVNCQQCFSIRLCASLDILELGSVA